MKLKYRFTLLFSFFVFIILMISVTSIYLLCEEFRKDDFVLRLKKNAALRYRLFHQNRDNKILKGFGQEQEAYSLSQENVFICDSTGNVLYSYPLNVDRLKDFTHLIRKAGDKEITFKENKRDGLVIPSREYGGVQEYIIATGFDTFGLRKMHNLKFSLGFTLLGGLLLSALLAFLFFRQVMRPITEFNTRIKNITENKLDERVDIGKNYQELNVLASSFNNMLNRLQTAFEMQKSFVQYASHELRTPIANMLTQTEAALNKPLSAAELQKVLASLREDQVAMSQLINSLLLLSQFETQSNLTKLFPVRVDEVIYEIIEAFKESHPEATIHINFLTVPDNSSYLTIKGNEALLQTAIRNLVTNAFQYAEDKTVSISISADEDGIVTVFENRGKQITGKEKENLFIPFFRGDNSAAVKGVGLGLSIVQRIVLLHKGTIEYRPVDDAINQFILRFKA